MMNKMTILKILFYTYSNYSQNFCICFRKLFQQISHNFWINRTLVIYFSNPLLNWFLLIKIFVIRRYFFNLLYHSLIFFNLSLVYWSFVYLWTHLRGKIIIFDVFSLLGATMIGDTLLISALLFINFVFMLQIWYQTCLRAIWFYFW